MFRDLVKSADGQVYVIAEACDNHMGSMEMARALCRAAKYAEADAVKFQHHLAYEEMLKQGTMSDNFEEHLFDFLERNALSLEQHFELRNYCNEIGITYLCTPFSLRAAQEIAELVPFFKIGSGEFQDRWFIDGLKILNKPVIFSSGMSNHSEVQENVEYLLKADLDFALLNCLSEYPPKFQDMNLKFITQLVDEFPDIVIGHSDHTQTTFTSVLAVSLGAQIIEKHITLSEMIHGPDKDVSLGPDQFRQLVKELRAVNQTLGSKKIINDDEIPVREWAYRSVVATTDILPGTILDLDHICTKRPGAGIPSKDYKSVIGKKVVKHIFKNTMIDWEDLE